ncbi:MAG TPA: Kae1-associated kinase Bud32, partial [Ignisphaera sp.]|nr:Kae1-associated kinase Bud32 [Ignisphaera sp.]
MEDIGKEVPFADLLREHVFFISNEGMKELPLVTEIAEIWRGAEAIVYRASFLGIESVIKWRFPKVYMPRDLDKQFRIFRTSIEVKAILKAVQAGINVPVPLFVDIEEGLIILMYIDGVTFRDLANTIEEKELCRICNIIGSYAGKLHQNSITHGDLTTGNVIVDKEGIVYLIDFGLAEFSSRLEDHAVDVHIFFRSIESSHSEREEIMKECFIKGYESIRKDLTKRVLDLVEEIRKRGRYVAERRLRTEW